MDIFDLLKQDHKKVQTLFKDIEKVGDSGGGSKKQMFAEVKQELDLHAQIEEALLYPALKQHDETKDLALEGVEEHKQVKTLLSEIDKMPTANDKWDAKFTVLVEDVEHHVEEEESELFKKAKKVLTKDEQERMLAAAQEMKQKVHPSAQAARKIA